MAKVDASAKPRVGQWALVAVAWLPVLIPLGWGIWQTVKKAAVLFKLT